MATQELEGKQFEEPLKISIANQTKSFNEFLSLSDNDRIIFSGIFGIGKTYFLDKFFEHPDSKYVGIHLFPTNYSISSNEDIFDYIKFDILYELLLRQPYLEKIELSTPQMLHNLSADDQLEICMKFIEAIPEIGKKVVDVLKPLQEIVKKLAEKKILIDEGKQIEEFQKRMISKHGSIYENDLYTELITKLIHQLKDGGKKQVVVVVDDLDRIDPEHIFRILNIFAVHFDGNKISEYQNKFNIDKIILSCDVNNIRLMFGARYGIETDFNGYIDKFYSKEVYHYDNRKFISDAVEEITSTITFTGSTIAVAINKPVLLGFLNYLLKSMINSNSLSLRTILRLYRRNFAFHERSLYFFQKEIKRSKLFVTQVFDLLINLFETAHSFTNAIEKTTFGNTDSVETHKAFLLILILSDSGNHRFDMRKVIRFEEQFGYRLLFYSASIEIGSEPVRDSNLAGLEEKSEISSQELKAHFSRALKTYIDAKNNSHPI